MDLHGHHITKNTVVGMSVGTIIIVLVAAWTASGIGRPLFAIDLERISAAVLDHVTHMHASMEEKIDRYQNSTAVQILNIRKSALQSELRDAKRHARRNPDDNHDQADVDEIRQDIAELDAKIICYRTFGCEVEPAI